MKFKVGDKVKLKRGIKAKEYITSKDCNWSISDFDLECIKNMKELIVSNFDESDGTLKFTNGNGNWYPDTIFKIADKNETEDVIEEVKEQLKENSNDIEKMLDKMQDILKATKEESSFEKAMKEAIIEKGKEIATKDLEERIKKNLDKFIKENYGILPKEVVIKQNQTQVKLKGIFHKDFDKICSIVANDIPLMLVGGAGAGKNYTLEQVAKGLGLTFYSTNAVSQEYKLTGFIDANGVYHETEFYKAFKNGGMFFLDEIDASNPDVLITLNSAIANRYYDFPIGRIEAHKDFRVVCAGNTFGTGADMVYVGRNVLDGATLDRFVVLEFDYDEQVERQLAYDEELYLFIKDLRNAINKSNLRYIVSMRALINATKLLEIGIDKETILKTVIIKNMQIDDLNVIINKLNSSNPWVREMEKLC